MARKDWINVGINAKLINAIDNFLKSDDAEDYKLKNRQQFVNRLITDFFWRYKESTGKDYIEIDMHEDILDLADYAKPKKTKK
ncbi:MAG: hypothetical protein ACREAD_03545 [Nitrosopumilaceae archaeon]